MSSDDIWALAAAAALIVIAGLVAGVEAAFTRMSRVRADELARAQRRGADRLQEVTADPARYVNLTLLLRVACEITAVVIVTYVFIHEGSSRVWLRLLLVALTMVVISYVAVGVAPRTVGRQNADSVALAGAVVFHPLERILGPLPQLLIALGNALTPGRGFREGPFASESELRALVDLAEETRVIEADERRMVHSVFELGDTIAREVMVPRIDMVFIERHKTLRQASSLALRSGFSRIPVVGDGADDVVGIVYLKDVVKRTHEYHEAESTEHVESVMRPAVFVPDSKPVDELLRDMQLNQVHMVVVVDEYGGTAGIVTIEDILEEIVGEIADEYDTEGPTIERLPNGSVRVTARLAVEELAELFHLQLDDEDVDTVGGLLAKHLGRVPIPGASVTVGGLSLTAESAEGRRNRVSTVLVSRASAA